MKTPRHFFPAVIFALITTSEPAVAQQSWDLKPYTITMPRVTTAQQNSPATVPQQEGNVVYNTDQKTLALNDGTSWGYLGAGISEEFRNFKAFVYQDYPLAGTYSWVIPSGVKRFMVEAWGGGESGGIYTTATDALGRQVRCMSDGTHGFGTSGGFARLIENVVPGVNTLNIIVGKRGVANSGTPSGIPSKVEYNYKRLTAYGGDYYGIVFGGSYQPNDGSSNITDAQTFFVRSGAPHPVSFDYVQKDVGNYVLNVRLSDGGLSYGAIPGQANQGASVAMLNGTSPLVYSLPSRDSSYPGIGGGCGYFSSGDGSNGLIIIRW